jgi:hypothetical protein
MDSALAAGIIGGLIGGTLGVLTSVVGTYWGPRKLQLWQESHADEPKKQLLRDLLDDPQFPDGRYLETLRLYTGTTAEDCRRLLIQVKARGIKLQEGEGWVLIKNKPFDQQ